MRLKTVRVENMQEAITFVSSGRSLGRTNIISEQSGNVISFYYSQTNQVQGGIPLGSAIIITKGILFTRA